MRFLKVESVGSVIGRVNDVLWAGFTDDGRYACTVWVDEDGEVPHNYWMGTAFDIGAFWVLRYGDAHFCIARFGISGAPLVVEPVFTIAGDQTGIINEVIIKKWILNPLRVSRFD